MDFAELEAAIDKAVSDAACDQSQWPEADLLKLGRLLGEKSDQAFDLFRAK